MGKTYVISGRSDARMTSLDGETYSSSRAAWADVRRVGPVGAVRVMVADGWLVYASRIDAMRDNDGSLAIATIEVQS